MLRTNLGGEHYVVDVERQVRGGILPSRYDPLRPDNLIYSAAHRVLRL
jgi:hypothetical protein